MNRLFFDYNATTPVREEVMTEMLPFFSENFGNPSSIHRWGQRGREAVESAREKVAALISASSEEIVFTSGGSEANSLALAGTALNLLDKKGHIIVSSIEHPSVLRCAEFLEGLGFRISKVKPDSHGVVPPDQVFRELRRDTILISIMHSNNETGALQPVEEISTMAHERGIRFHTDAVQSAGKVQFSIKKIDPDLLPLSSHKFYGPKGIGALYVKKGERLSPLIFGGGQEKGLRGGTEMVPQIVGMGVASSLAAREIDHYEGRLSSIRNEFERTIKEKIPGVIINAEDALRLPNTSSVIFKGVDAHSLMISLDLEGVGVSTGSACHSGTVEPSHVLLDMGISREDSLSTLRISFGRMTSLEDALILSSILNKKVTELRSKKRG
ncbi:MAG: cysteine desulfurase family protein [Acidobacteriota bacterium]